MKPVWIAGLSVLALALSGVEASAQPVLGAKSGIVNYTMGTVYLGGKLLEMGPAQFPEIKENTELRTQDGRAEVLLTPGVVLRIGENTAFKMISTRLIDTRLDLLSGSGVVEAADIAKDTKVTLVCNGNDIVISKGGLYRIDAEPARVKVFKGSAEVTSAGQNVQVGGGKMLELASASAGVQKFDQDDTDSLDNWSRRRGELMAMANVSAANRVRTVGAVSPCYGGYNGSPMMTRNLLGSWGYNPYYGLGTYIPCNGSIYSPYGFRYWSPMAVYRAFYAPRPVYNPNSGMGGFGGPSYRTMGPTSGGYSGTMSAPAAVSSAPAAASSAGSTAASSAGTSSVGHGSGGGGGRGH
jgi:hypothetical protein